MLKLDATKVNKPEAAASLLDKAGKLLEKERPEDATGLYEKVWIIVMMMIMAMRMMMTIRTMATMMTMVAIVPA